MFNNYVLTSNRCSHSLQIMSTLNYRRSTLGNVTAAHLNTRRASIAIAGPAGRPSIGAPKKDSKPSRMSVGPAIMAASRPSMVFLLLGILEHSCWTFFLNWILYNDIHIYRVESHQQLWNERVSLVVKAVICCRLQLRLLCAMIPDRYRMHHSRTKLFARFSHFSLKIFMAMYWLRRHWWGSR